MLRIQNQHGRMALIALVFIVIIVVLISIISNKLQQEVTDIAEDKTPIKKAEIPKKVQAARAAKKNTSNVLTRRTITVRGNDFIEHWFYRGDEVLAQQQVNTEGIINTEGEIADGKYKFTDPLEKTYGYAHYEDGYLDGPTTVYYEDGTLKEQASYRKGKLTAKKEHYNSGQIRFELDLSDARHFGDNREVGIGKLYWANGNLKYEWYMTRRDPIGYKKSYNRDGVLRHADYYDEHNNLIKKRE